MPPGGGPKIETGPLVDMRGISKYQTFANMKLRFPITARRLSCLNLRPTPVESMVFRDEDICRGLANQKQYDESGRVCAGNLDAEALNSLDETMADPVVLECMQNSVSQSDVSQSSDISRGSLMLAPISSDRKQINYPDSSAFPAHWTDTKHEPDGTDHRHLVTQDVVAEECFGAFSVGEDKGEDILIKEMCSLVERYS